MEHVAQSSAAPPHRRRDWPRAWHALRSLIEDPERTDQVFEIIGALSGNAFDRAFERFAATREGRRLLVERPSLLAALSDRAALRSMPEGSLGRAYADFMEAGSLEAAGLVAADEMASERLADDRPEDPDRQYFGERLRDMHDLWHVLTGYGRDEAGEAANLAFTLGQVWNLGIAAIVAAGAVVGPKDVGLTWPRYLYRAWRRGHRAALLSAAPYEQLLPLPLEDVRRQLDIEPARLAHPAGIVVANRGQEPQFV